MSIHVYRVLVVRAWTYEYGLNQMMSGGFSLGMESCKGLGSVSLKNKQPTHTPTSETYLFYVYCVLVIRAWTYEYAQGRMSIHVYCV